MNIDMSLPKTQRILQAAEEVFARYGYEKATLDEIIALADVGKGTVYKYFGNKEQLFYKLVADKNAPFVERLQQAVAGDASFEQKLWRYFHEMISFYSENSELWQIICFEMLSAGKGFWVKETDDSFEVLPRYIGRRIDEATKESTLRYHMLLFEEYNILRSLIDEAMTAGLLKQNTVPDIASKFVFFGVAMSIFEPNKENALQMSVEDATAVVVDHFLHGNAL